MSNCDEMSQLGEYFKVTLEGLLDYVEAASLDVVEGVYMGWWRGIFLTPYFK
jgi:hypothetical protein